MTTWDFQQSGGFGNWRELFLIGYIALPNPLCPHKIKNGVVVTIRSLPFVNIYFRWCAVLRAEVAIWLVGHFSGDWTNLTLRVLPAENEFVRSLTFVLAMCD